MSEKLELHIQKQKLQRKINKMIDDFREDWPGLIIDVERVATKVAPQRQAKVRLIARDKNQRVKW